jgi:adenosine deaminase
MSLTSDWYDRIPKVELHLHLEGAIPHAALWPLIEKYGDPTITSLAALQERFAYRDFPHFLETWVWKNGFLREYEDFTLIAAAVARDLAAQNIRYVEAFFSPSDFARHGLRVQRIAEAVRAGLDQAHEVEVALVADLVRNNSVETAARILAEVNEVRACGIIGIGIGGAEHLFPPEPFAAVYAEARRLGFRTSAHAGEAAGPPSVWGAVRALQAGRIGHATRAAEDDALVDYLAEQRIPVELCPLSNVRTGVVPSVAQHPVRRYVQRGLLVSINTDDPKMFGNSLAEEYRQLAAQQDFTPAEICGLILQGIESSWLPDERKHQLTADFSRHTDWRTGNGPVD